MREFSKLPLVMNYGDDLPFGQCAYCGITAPIRGSVNVGADDALICERCHDRTGERTFSLYLRGGQDVMCDGMTLEGAFQELATYYQNPVDYGRYAPFVLYAEADDGRREVIGTFTMPDDDIKRSRLVHYGRED